LYGQRVRLHLVERLRDEQKFADREALVAQIERDIAAARTRLADLSPERDSWY
jgi:riboflavin kinase/FMN adenylyltransferase